jgi:hypothetical protein
VVNANHAQAHALAGDLDRQVAEAATSAGDHYPLAWLGFAALESGVDGHTGA